MNESQEISQEKKKRNDKNENTQESGLDKR